MHQKPADKKIPAPEDWKLTISDLMEEMKAGKRKSIGSPEIDWARDYERSLVPSHMRYPQKGDVYEVIDDMSVTYMTSWAAPFTGSGEGVLKKGERLLIDGELSDEKPISVYGIALNYEEIEKRIVPSSDRSSPKYDGFYFPLQTVDLNTKYRLVQTDYK